MIASLWRLCPPFRLPAWTPAFVVLSTAVLWSGCGGDAPDAYGNFEATEITVSAEVSGRLMEFAPDEGTSLTAGRVVGVVDTTNRSLQRRELQARRQTARDRVHEAARQIDVTAVQLETAREELERDRRLLADSAATPRQVNLQAGDVRRLERQMEANRARLTAARSEIESVNAQIAQVHQHIGDSRITNPVDGVVLNTYVQPGEFVQPGQPLYDVASLDTLTLRAYVSGAQLSQIRLGQRVTVSYDVGADSLASLPGRVTHVASDAEFTPTPIQTREERVDFVYAVEVDVENPEGALKIGMPGELSFDPPPSRADVADADRP